MELRVQTIRAILVIAVLAAPNGEARGWGRRNQPVYRAPVYTAPSYVAPKVVVPPSSASTPSVRPSTTASDVRTDSVVRKVEYQDGQTLSVEYRTTPVADGVGVQTDRRVYAIRNSAGGWNYFKDNETYQPKVKPTVPVPAASTTPPATQEEAVAAVTRIQQGLTQKSQAAGATAAALQREIDAQVTMGVKNDILDGIGPTGRYGQAVAQGIINRQAGGGLVPLDTLVSRAGLTQTSQEGTVKFTDKRNLTGVAEKESAPTLVVRVDPSGDRSQTERMMDRFSQKYQQTVMANELGTIKQAGSTLLSSATKVWKGLSDPELVTAEMLRATGLAAPTTLSEDLSALGNDVGRLGAALKNAVQAHETNKINVLTALDTSKELEKAYGEYRKPITGEQSYATRVNQYYADKKVYDQKRAELVKQGLSSKEIDERLPPPIIPSPSAAEVVGQRVDAEAPPIADRLIGRPRVLGRAVRGKVSGQVAAEAGPQLGGATANAAQLASSMIGQEMFKAYASVAEAFKSLPAGISAAVGLVTHPEAAKALKAAVGEGNVAMRVPLKADGKKSQLWLQLPKEGDPKSEEKLERVARLTALLAKAASAKGEPLTKEEADKIVTEELDREKRESEEKIRKQFDADRKKSESDRGRDSSGSGPKDEPSSAPKIDQAAENEAVENANKEIDSAVSDQAPEELPRPHHQTTPKPAHD